MAEFTGKVHESNLQKVEDFVKKLNKKATKLGLVPLTINIGPAITEEDPDTHRVQVFHDVIVTGESPVIAGWHLVAVLNHFIDMNVTPAEYTNLVRLVPGETLPEKYRSEKPVCDHCGHNRYRKDTFVVQHEDGTYKQVGSGCVADFLGHANPKTLLEFAKYPEAFESNFRGWGEPQGYYPTYTVDYFLTLTSAVIRKRGWVSSAQSREGSGIATFVEVLDQISEREKINPKKENIIPTTEEDHKIAINAIEWVKNFSKEEISKNDYLYNCYVVVKTGIVNDKTFAITASIIPSYKRHIAKFVEAQKTKKESNFFGNAGDKFDRELTFNTRFEFAQARFGYYSPEVGYIYKFTDEDGNVFVWSTSSYYKLENGEKVTVTGRIKGHKEYKGVKQTTLTRCKIKE